MNLVLRREKVDGNAVKLEKEKLYSMADYVNSRLSKKRKSIYFSNSLIGITTWDLIVFEPADLEYQQITNHMGQSEKFEMQKPALGAGFAKSSEI